MKLELEGKINSLYESRCPYCGQIVYTSHMIWDKDEPIEVWFKCNCKKGKIVRSATTQDKQDSINPYLKPLPYPDSDMIPNSRINISGGQKVSDLFTPRALVGLSYIRDYIDRIENHSVKDIMEIVLTGALSQASKLVFVIRNRKNKQGIDKGAEVGSWVAGYWVPEEHFEINVWNCFENRFSRVKKGLSEINSIFRTPPTIADHYIENGIDGVVGLGSATKINMPDNSVDYVFTDPPHVNRVLYLEMSLMWNTWLGKKDIDWDEEIVISESKERCKDFKDYYNLLNSAISEIGRVLKLGKVFSIAFNSLDDCEWKALFDVCTRNGFRVTEIRPLEYSATSVMQDNRKNALKTDFVLSFVNEKKIMPDLEIDSSKEHVNTLVEDILKVRPMKTYEVINEAMIRTVSTGRFMPPGVVIDALDASPITTYNNYTWTITH